MSDDDENLFNKLSDREKQILKDRFGIDLSLPLQEGIGSQFDVAWRRIKEMEEKALKKIKKRKQQMGTSQKSCSFCKKPHSEAKKIIETETGVTICIECVTLCNELINEQNKV